MNFEFKDILILTVLIIIACVVLGCIGPKSDSFGDSVDVGYSDISVIEAKELLDNDEGVNDIFLLDVRTVSEFSSGHLEGAVNIDVAKLSSRLDEVPTDKTILVYCRTGARSARASNLLVDAGYMDVYNMQGGITTWISEGYNYVS